ncbi:hypothetical protein KIL84_000511 [Mauremys mutica]|uniref:Uncharacterized protein n=1 Tax=Mauremys mutica TaxID=74926 RepID=A0A9D3WYJ4_9SAUR|nr:hypothetical protein KIL84_000511 [Mauremys mutica]
MGSLPLPAHGPKQLQDAPVTPEPSGQCVSASPTSAGGREGRVRPAAFWLRAPALGPSPHRSGTQLSSSRRVTREPAATPPFCNRGQPSPVVPVRNGARASQVPPGCFRAAGAGVGWALLPPPQRCARGGHCTGGSGAEASLQTQARPVGLSGRVPGQRRGSYTSQPGSGRHAASAGTDSLSTRVAGMPQPRLWGWGAGAAG